MSKIAIILFSATGLALSSCLSTHAPTTEADYQSVPAAESLALSVGAERPTTNPSTFELTRGSEVRLSGSATIGSWSSASRTLRATLDPGIEPEQISRLVERLKANPHKDGAPREITPEQAQELRPAGEPAIALTVPVASLRSGNSRMEADMHEALKAKAHPRISYNFTQIRGVTWQQPDGAREPVFILDTQGDLSLAGVTRSVQMDVRVIPRGDSQFSVVGRKRLSMEDFGIEPPTALLGLIKADDTVEVVFDLNVAPADQADEDEATSS